MSEEFHRPEQRMAGSEALGQSEAFIEFMERLSKVARVDRPVLLMGERGTGKELAANRLHFLSQRWQGGLVTLNCAALAPSLIESELFGYEAGAFTGATRRRVGRFEQADGGTLFLDEIATIPLEVQEKILRVVEYGSFERVGSSIPIQVDVRIIGATNVDLRTEAAENRFKQDLLDRLSFEVLFLPPLRERAGDIPLLANHFAARMEYELGRDWMPEFSDETMAHLEEYPWPGNVRELKNVVERAVYQSDEPLITGIVFDPFDSPYRLPKAGKRVTEEKTRQGAQPEIQGAPAEKQAVPLLKPLKQAVQELESSLLNQALAEAKFNQKKAAELLDLTYNQFRGLYRKYLPDVKAEE